jgi:hypothetical protein
MHADRRPAAAAKPNSSAAATARRRRLYSLFTPRCFIDLRLALMMNDADDHAILQQMRGIGYSPPGAKTRAPKAPELKKKSGAFEPRADWSK